MTLNAPVAIFGFNRPEATERVFARVRAACPSKLLLILDGPRPEKYGDVEKCEAVKRVFGNVDWPCEVFRNYSETNMGCRRRMASGITWVFEHVEEAILLEDDCVPDSTYFRYCEELLEHYRHDSRIGMIAGHIEHFKPLRTNGYSYYVDHFCTIWGWATWRRAWSKYDEMLTTWPLIKKQDLLMQLFQSRRFANTWARMIERVIDGKIDTWDTAWAMTMFRENWLCIHPVVNLVTNIGFGSQSTNTPDVTSSWANRPIVPMNFPLVHPISLIPDVLSERYIQEMYSQTYINKIKHRLNKYLRVIMNKYSI